MSLSLSALISQAVPALLCTWTGDLEGQAGWCMEDDWVAASCSSELMCYLGGEDRRGGLLGGLAGLLGHLAMLKKFFFGLMTEVMTLYFVIRVFYLLTSCSSFLQAPHLFVTSLPAQSRYWKTLAFFTRITSYSLAGMKFLR